MAETKVYRAAIIGCGRPGGKAGATGAGISHAHANAYKQLPNVELVALADIVQENAEAFREMHGGDAIFTDYHEMIAEVRPDIVSICTWPALHEPMVIACTAAGVPMTLSEKPMSPTWAAAKRMQAAAEDAGTIVCFNHQRRFDAPYVRLRELLRDGRLGALKRMEFQTDNLFDWGTHWFDMMHFLNEETPATSILCGSDPTGGPSYFGVTMEGAGVTTVLFGNGVRAVMLTGNGTEWGAQIRVWGELGVAEIGATGWDSLRWWAPGQSDWVTETFAEKPDAFAAAVANMIEGFETGTEPELSIHKSIRATELVFGAYESARTSRKLDLPLTAEDVAIRFEA